MKFRGSQSLKDKSAGSVGSTGVFARYCTSSAGLVVKDAGGKLALSDPN
jgi:hypothetical protein